ncbi:MAG TPA: hypothetical protein ENH94_01145 [Phycisphaerales bacterium]|nr:hypothetical protein [Phycisphaerales bacterium]
MTKTKHFEFDTKASLFSEKPAKSHNLFYRNKPNFNHPNITSTPCDRETYNDLQANPKNGTNPNKANLKPIPKKEKPQLSGDTQAKNKKMKSKPNFPPGRVEAFKVYINCNHERIRYNS